MNITIKEDYIVKKDYLKNIVEPRIGTNITENHVVFEINETTYMFMELCNGRYDFEQIVDKLSEIFDNTDYEVLLNDFMEVKDFLMNVGIIKYGDEDYKSIIRQDKLIIPDHISYEITNVCQLKCKHCFNSYDSMNGKAMEFTNVDNMKSLFEKSKELNIQSIFLTGGECQLHPEFETIVKKSLDYFNRVSVGTNGYKKLSQSFIEEIQHSNVSFQISIDGNVDYHNQFRGKKESYQKAIGNIKKLCEMGIEVQVAYTLHADNLPYVETEIKNFKNMGVCAVNLGNVARQGNATLNELQPLRFDEFMKLSERLAKMYSDDNFKVGLEDGVAMALERQLSNGALNKCGAGYKIIHIKPDFSVVPCPAIYNMNIGKNAHENLLTIMLEENVRTCMEMESPTQSKCDGCELEFQCGGCLANMLEEKERGVCHYG